MKISKLAVFHTPNKKIIKSRIALFMSDTYKETTSKVKSNGNLYKYKKEFSILALGSKFNLVSQRQKSE